MGKWNVAGDYAINNILISCGFHLPEDVLKGIFSLDESAESIYNKLPDKRKGNSGGGKGVCSGGDIIDYDSPDPGNCGGVMDTPGANGGKATQSELDQSEQENKIMVAQAAQAARMMGKLPSSLERFVTELLEPKILWTNVLREFVNSNAKNDYSWFPPNRRHIYRNIFLPSVRNEELGEVVVMVDTSGSIGNDDLKQFASEMTAILDAYDATCTVIYCDADVAGTQVFTRMDLPLTLEAKGGGGTDFRPPFKWLEKESLVPKCCIYLTDLECNQFPPEPEFPVLWAKIGKWGCEPPFGLVIEMDKA
jgi:predicted metal-dependent peptidase